MELPPCLPQNPKAGRRQVPVVLSVVVVASACITLLLGTGAVGVFFFGWWPVSPGDFPGFEATPAQCETVYGQPLRGSFAKPQLAPRSLWYSDRGWYVLVSFDEHNRAEQFIFCKATITFLGSLPMTKAQQNKVLEDAKQGSTWDPTENGAEGSLWNRNDGQAAAFYVASSRWMILMNREAWDRFNAHPDAQTGPR